jgi:hypothetical protein
MILTIPISFLLPRRQSHGLCRALSRMRPSHSPRLLPLSRLDPPVHSPTTYHTSTTLCSIFSAGHRGADLRGDNVMNAAGCGAVIVTLCPGWMKRAVSSAILMEVPRSTPRAPSCGRIVIANLKTATTLGANPSMSVGYSPSSRASPSHTTDQIDTQLATHASPGRFPTPLQPLSALQTLQSS